MKKKVYRVAAVLLSAALLTAGFSACGSYETPPQSGMWGTSAAGKAAVRDSVVVAVSQEPENGLDPCLGGGHGTTPLVQSALLSYSEDMQLQNDLATDYSISEDGLTWRFTLREDACFTDGTSVTPQDVVFTYQTAKESQSDLDLTNLKSVEAAGNTVVFTFFTPNSAFSHFAATLGIVPAHAYSAAYMDNPIGSGPWKLVQWNRGEQMILEANTAYYGAVPTIKKVTIVFMEEDAALLAAQAGQVDVALVSATQAGREIPGMRLESISTMDNRGITLPMSPAVGKTTAEGDPIGNDVTCNLSIRHALAYAMDREKIAEDAVNSYGDPAYSENDGMPWNNPAVQIQTDKAYAESLLREDGWVDADGDGIVEKNGIKAAFTCLYPSGDSVRQAVAMAAAAQAREIGIEILVKGESWEEISRQMFANAVLMGWGSADPYTSYMLYSSGNALQKDFYNPQGYASTETDRYFQQALETTDAETANAYWQKAQWDGDSGTAMQGDCPWVWLVNIKHLYYVKNGLDIGKQQLHAHGASWTLLQNLKDWRWN